MKDITKTLIVGGVVTTIIGFQVAAYVKNSQNPNFSEKGYLTIYEQLEQKSENGLDLKNDASIVLTLDEDMLGNQKYHLSKKYAGIDLYYNTKSNFGNISYKGDGRNLLHQYGLSDTYSSYLYMDIFTGNVISTNGKVKVNTILKETPAYNIVSEALGIKEKYTLEELQSFTNLLNGVELINEEEATSKQLILK